MNQHIEYLQYVESQCLRCHSCSCFHSTSKIGPVCYGEMATLLLHGKTAELKDSIFGCHQCGRCLKKCPREFNAKEFMFHARAFLEEKESNLCRCYDSVRVDHADNVFSKQKQANNVLYDDALLGDGECNRLFVPGCHMSSGFPELTKKVMTFLKENGIADGMTALCCGNPLYAAGLYKEFNDYIEKMEAMYKAHNVQAIVTPCPSCYDFNCRVQEMGYLKGISVQCLSQELVNHGVKINRAAFPDDYTVSIHDSCPDRKNGVFADSIRALYADFTIREMPHNRQNGLCCGCGGLVPPYSAEVSQEGKDLKRMDFEQSGSDCMITTCFNCYKGLRPMLPIHQYLEDLMEGIA